MTLKVTCINVDIGKIFVHIAGHIQYDSDYVITSLFNHRLIPIITKELPSISFISHDLANTDYIAWSTHFTYNVHIIICINCHPLLAVSLIANSSCLQLKILDIS